MRMDLNADVGEWSSGEGATVDAAVMPHITSANIACGVHAGDAATMRATVELARLHGVAVGAHPALRDPEGFGRRELPVTASEVERLVVQQIETLLAIADSEGVKVRHVKPHGALYAMAARDGVLADAIVNAVVLLDRSLLVFGPPGSQLMRACERFGVQGVAEGFADRAYSRDGSLVPRTESGAVIDEPARVVERAVRLAAERTVIAADGSVLRLDVETICVHGDTPGAAALAMQIRRALEDAGVEVRAAGDQ